MNAIRLLKEVDNLTLDGLIDLGYNPYLPAFEKVIPGLIQAFGNNPNENIYEAIEVLKG